MAGEFHLQILGRTIEHLGSQMYRHRAPSIAELVANCWDAGARNVWVTVPNEANYDPDGSSISILDDGQGMTAEAVQDQYLVIGRNRRDEDGGENQGRKVMGRKGIGKLAGFGLASRVTITTWASRMPKAVHFTMSLQELKRDAGEVADVKFPWGEVDKSAGWPASGTMITLSQLRHASSINVAALTETLARRFSRTTRGQMAIHVNGAVVTEPAIELLFQSPAEDDFNEETLPTGAKVLYRYAFAKTPIRSKELQGFAIYAHGRTAQAPPFFFNVESTASGQHSTRYVFGDIQADYLDDGVNDESDLTSTDRQELDWEKEELKELKEWGEALTRRVLIECAELKGKEVEQWVLEIPEFKDRLTRLDKAVTKEISRFLMVLGQRSPKGDERTLDLANALIRAYEFRNFHDVVEDINAAGQDPEKLEQLLARLHDWKVLESRAILEIVKGRLSVIERLRDMVIANKPETPSKNITDNLHDLLAEYPWLFNPEWQVFAEEKSIGKILKDWGHKDAKEEMENKRIDFLAFHRDEDILVIIELKRPAHAVELEELQRLQRYQDELGKAYKRCLAVLVHEGQINVRESTLDGFLRSTSFQLLKWSDIFARASRFYSHYRAVLEGDVGAPGFVRKETEVLRTREILETDTSRRGEKREQGLGDTEP
jgi:hypothetical protein